MDTNEIITGERIQDCADIFVGFEQDFQYNPFIYQIKNKHTHFHEFNKYYPSQYENPRVIFCYGHNILHFSLIMSTFKNPFVLITHNSDENIINKETVNNILEHPLLIRWYGQNVDYVHPKLRFLPIGLANSQWPHGNLLIYEHIFNTQIEKTQSVFMNFKVDTNPIKRIVCKNILEKKINMLQMVDPITNILRLSLYKYCICPEGNGLDTHRLWECYYLRVVPILLRNTYSEIIQKETGLPMILLHSWMEFDYDKLPEYHTFDFSMVPRILTMDYIKKTIQNEFM
jgi:hypothetical protein